MKNKQGLKKNLAAAVMASALFAMPFAAMAQSRVEVPKNKYTVAQDVQLGRQAAQQAEQQFPILNDSSVTNYVQGIGDRLVDGIPQEYQRPEFRYNFKVINARDINAFALPGGPMYVNRGMIEAAKTEGEMAGVMAHEISHIVLRHGTAQATAASRPQNQIGSIAAILGGAILGGQAGAAIGGTIVQGLFNSTYSRPYETNADILGAQIMANAGYDPRDLANMFRTIEQQSGGARGPEFLSSHPNPANRYQRINQEAALLRVSERAQRDSREFNNIQARLRGMGRAPSSAEIAQRGSQGGATNSPTANGVYSSRVGLPSTRYRAYNTNFLRLSVPDNFREFGDGGSSVQFAPEGAYGNEGITHGVLIGVAQSQSRDLGQATDAYLQSVLQGNSYLRQQRGYTQGTIDRRDALTTTLVGTSPVTRRAEVVTVYTTQLRDGSLLYMATVVPQAERPNYNRAFNQILQSLQIND